MIPCLLVDIYSSEHILKSLLKCPSVEYYRELLLTGGMVPICWDSDGTVFSSPKVMYDLKIKAVCNLRQ